MGVLTARAATLRTKIPSEYLGKVYYFLFCNPKPAKFLEGHHRGVSKRMKCVKNEGAFQSEKGERSALAPAAVLTSAPSAGNGPKEAPRWSSAARVYIAKVLRKEAGGSRCHHAPRTFQDRLPPLGHCLPAGLMSPS